MDIARAAEESEFFYHRKAWRSGETIEGFQLLEGLTQHSGTGSGVRCEMFLAAKLTRSYTNFQLCGRDSNGLNEAFPGALHNGRGEQDQEIQDGIQRRFSSRDSSGNADPGSPQTVLCRQQQVGHQGLIAVLLSEEVHKTMTQIVKTYLTD